jgi:hypothetical protein
VSISGLLRHETIARDLFEVFDFKQDLGRKDGDVVETFRQLFDMLAETATATRIGSVKTRKPRFGWGSWKLFELSV